MSQPGELAYDDANRELMEMIRNRDGGGGGFVDGHMGHSQTEACTQQPGTNTHRSDTYIGQPGTYADEMGLDPEDWSADPKKSDIGESFNMREDELLCNAWLATKIDSIHGMEQKDNILVQYSFLVP